MNEDFSKRSKLSDIGRWYVNRHVTELARRLVPGTKILDAGAGECVYKPFFSHCEYKAIDLAVGENRWDYSHLDYVGPLHEMPIPDETFDAVLCTQVMEHLEWPRESVREMFRVLKAGGKLYITVPMAHSEHQVPYDFFRYTSFGLRSVCKHAGFAETVVTPFGGVFTRWAYELPRILSVFPGSGGRSGKLNIMGLLLLPLRALTFVGVRVTQALLLWLDRFDKQRDFPFGWACEATKAAAAGAPTEQAS
jgi:ubiquinone/menaquinone biosynthesis C-methylase UbiE